jgi:hypothetical protein
VEVPVLEVVALGFQRLGRHACKMNANILSCWFGQE